MNLRKYFQAKIIIFFILLLKTTNAQVDPEIIEINRVIDSLSWQAFEYNIPENVILIDQLIEKCREKDYLFAEPILIELKITVLVANGNEKEIHRMGEDYRYKVEQARKIGLVEEELKYRVLNSIVQGRINGVESEKSNLEDYYKRASELENTKMMLFICDLIFELLPDDDDMKTKYENHLEEYFKETQFRDSIVYCFFLNVMGNRANNKKQYTEAKEYYSESLKYAEELGFEWLSLRLRCDLLVIKANEGNRSDELIKEFKTEVDKLKKSGRISFYHNYNEQFYSPFINSALLDSANSLLKEDKYTKLVEAEFMMWYFGLLSDKKYGMLDIFYGRLHKAKKLKQEKSEVLDRIINSQINTMLDLNQFPSIEYFFASQNGTIYTVFGIMAKLKGNLVEFENYFNKGLGYLRLLGDNKTIIEYLNALAWSAEDEQEQNQFINKALYYLSLMDGNMYLESANRIGDALSILYYRTNNKKFLNDYKYIIKKSYKISKKNGNYLGQMESINRLINIDTVTEERGSQYQLTLLKEIDSLRILEKIEFDKLPDPSKYCRLLISEENNIEKAKSTYLDYYNFFIEKEQHYKALEIINQFELNLLTELYDFDNPSVFIEESQMIMDLIESIKNNVDDSEIKICADILKLYINIRLVDFQYILKRNRLWRTEDKSILDSLTTKTREKIDYFYAQFIAINSDSTFDKKGYSKIVLWKNIYLAIGKTLVEFIGRVDGEDDRIHTINLITDRLTWKSKFIHKIIDSYHHFKLVGDSLKTKYYLDKILSYQAIDIGTQRDLLEFKYLNLLNKDNIDILVPSLENILKEAEELKYNQLQLAVLVDLSKVYSEYGYHRKEENLLRRAFEIAQKLDYSQLFSTQHFRKFLYLFYKLKKYISLENGREYLRFTDEYSRFAKIYDDFIFLGYQYNTLIYKFDYYSHYQEPDSIMLYLQKGLKLGEDHFSKYHYYYRSFISKYAQVWLQSEDDPKHKSFFKPETVDTISVLLKKDDSSERFRYYINLSNNMHFVVNPLINLKNKDYNKYFEEESELFDSYSLYEDQVFSYYNEWETSWMMKKRYNAVLPSTSDYKLAWRNLFDPALEGLEDILSERNVLKKYSKEIAKLIDKIEDAGFTDNLYSDTPLEDIDTLMTLYLKVNDRLLTRHKNIQTDNEFTSIYKEFILKYLYRYQLIKKIPPDSEGIFALLKRYEEITTY